MVAELVRQAGRPAPHAGRRLDRAADGQYPGRGAGDALSAAQRMGDRSRARRGRDRPPCRRPGRDAADAAAAGRRRRRTWRHAGPAVPVRASVCWSGRCSAGASRSWRHSSPRPASSRSTIPPTAIPGMTEAASASWLGEADWADPARLAASASAHPRRRRGARLGAGSADRFADPPRRRRADHRAVRPAARTEAPAVARRLRRAWCAAAARSRPDAGDGRAGGRRNRHPFRPEARRRLALAAVHRPAATD